MQRQSLRGFCLRWAAEIIHTNRVSRKRGEKLSHRHWTVLANIPAKIAAPESIRIHCRPRSFPKCIHVAASWIEKTKIGNVSSPGETGQSHDAIVQAKSRPAAPFRFSGGSTECFHRLDREASVDGKSDPSYELRVLRNKE